MEFQPEFGWDGTVKYAGWLDIPSADLVSEKDACLAPLLQRQVQTARRSSFVILDTWHRLQSPKMWPTSSFKQQSLHEQKDRASAL